MLFDAIGGLVGAAGKMIFDKFQTDTTNQRNVDLWKQQQEYNSPRAQMLRLKEAGLNPALVYGHGAVAQMSAPPQMQRTEGQNPLHALPWAQVENLEAQNANIAAQNDILKEQAKGLRLDNWEKSRQQKISAQNPELWDRQDPFFYRLLLKSLGQSVIRSKVDDMAGSFQKTIDQLKELREKNTKPGDIDRAIKEGGVPLW